MCGERIGERGEVEMGDMGLALGLGWSCVKPGGGIMGIGVATLVVVVAFGPSDPIGEIQERK